MSNQSLPKVNIQEQLRFFRHIIWFVAFLFVILLLVVILGHMDDEVTGTGNVEGVRQYEIKTLVDAKITEIYKHSGESVQRGEKLVQFDDRNQRDIILTIKNEIKVLVFAEGGQEAGFTDAYTALNTQFGDPMADGYVAPWNK